MPMVKTNADSVRKEKGRSKEGGGEENGKAEAEGEGECGKGELKNQ